MDTSDPSIEFDHYGVCNHCHQMDEKAKRYVESDETKQIKLHKVVKEIKEQGKGKKYDCVIGLSGGVDSTFVAYLVKSLGLRPLAVHLDNGWDTEIAVKNIKSTLDILGIELVTVVLDWEEFKDIQLAFLKASTPDSEIPTDHAIYAALRNIASKYNIKYIVDGVNYTTETIMPKSWSQGYSDWGYIKKVHKKYGTAKLRTFPHYSFFNLFYYKRIKRQKTISILNYINYNKKDAKEIIEKELMWRDYGGKHHESYYTKFFQSYLLPTKFGFDKRRAHLSTLINSGQITREDALQEIIQPPFSETSIRDDIEYISKKFNISPSEFQKILDLNPMKYSDYRNNSRTTIEALEEAIFSTYNPFSIVIRKFVRIIERRNAR